MRKIFLLLFLCVSGFLFLRQPFHIRKTVALENAQIKEKVLICGICRNIEKAVPGTICSIEELGKRFTDYHAIIYENNSNDKTVSLLKQWEKENPHVIFLTEKLSSRSLCRELPMGIGHRIEKISRARNKVLDVAMNKKFDDYKYVIWADLDFLEPWNTDAIVETILHPEQEWDAVFAGSHYDLFALRSKSFPIGYELIGATYWKHLDQIREQFCPKVDDPWMEVYSAFGGLGIYKRDAIRGCRYSAVITKDLEKVVEGWLPLARESGDVLFLKEYDQFLAEGTAIVVTKPLERKQYPEHMGVRLPEGKITWFSLSKEATLPWTCEHLPFHATMILNGRDRLYINPNIQFNPF